MNSENWKGGTGVQSDPNKLRRTETPPPQYSDIDDSTTQDKQGNHAVSHLELPSNANSTSERTSMEHIVEDPANRRPSFDPQDPKTWKGAKWSDIKQQWKERHTGPREPKDPVTGRGQYTGLTPEELRAKIEGHYGTLLPKGQKRR